MNRLFARLQFGILAVVLAVGIASVCNAQRFLNKPLDVNISRMRVSEVLEKLSLDGGFYFSYGSDVLPGDSLVTFSAKNLALRIILDQLLKGSYQYKETGNYVIVQKAPPEKNTYLTGRIVDAETGAGVDFASVYSTMQLVSTLSGDDGSFRIKLRDRSFPVSLTISRIGYADTVLVIGSEQIGSALAVRLLPRAVDLDEVLVYSTAGDRTWLARLFVSSRLRRQSRNIGRFFVSLPYQASLTPGLGTHGRMSGQVVNKFSLNLLGGYTAGVNGLELAGAFNISKRDVRVAQVAGVFNIVSGKVHGVQFAGMHNHVIDSLSGLQAAGFGNIVGKTTEGVQIAGLFNKTAQQVRGVQIAGAVNLSGNKSRGFQISGLLNRSAGNYDGLQICGAFNGVQKSLSGVQISGLANVVGGEMNGFQLSAVNYARHTKGVQLGIVNVADSSSGYSIGIVNFIKKGKGSISVFSNDIVPFNIGWKTGSNKIYSILTVGAAVTPDRRAYTMGFGLGKQFTLGTSLALAAELSSHSVYLGTWENTQSLTRLQTLLEVRLTKTIYLSAGPSVTFQYGKQVSSEKGYLQFPRKTYANFGVGTTGSAWMGWQAGISWNYGASR